MEYFRANLIPSEVIVQLLAFVIVFWVLRRIAWRPFLNTLELRRERIEKEFQQIENAKKEVENLKAEYQSHLKKIDAEGRALLQQSVEEGRTIARDLQAKARADAQHILEMTKENLEIEIAKARVELRKEIADLALRVSERVLQEEFADEKKQEQKILLMLKELEKTL